MKNPRRDINKKAEPAADHPTVLINARLIDPASGRDEPGGLLIRDGKIADLGPHLRRNAPDGAEVIDCGGHVVCPGLIDMHVFTGEPGAEHRETLRTASQAAAAGGVTTIVVMPNTDPVIDDVALVDYIERRARDRALVHVHTMAALTRGLKGQEMTEIGLLQRAGAIAFTNGKASVASARVMRNALAYSKDFDALVVHYAEDATLAEAGVMNEGDTASRMGLPGIPKAAETLVLERYPPRRHYRRPLSRAARVVHRVPRRHSRRQGPRPERHLWRVGQPPDLERRCGRALALVLQA